MKKPKKLKKLTVRLAQVLFTMLMITSTALPVSAKSESSQNNYVEGDTLLPAEKLSDLPVKTGSIRLQLSEGAKGTKREGVEFSCAKVAEITDGCYVLEVPYQNFDIDPNQLKTAQEMEEATLKFASVEQGGIRTKTDVEGAADFTNLDVGVYLIKATDHTGYDDVTPFLISIPSWDESRGEMIYEITAEPKHSPKPQPEKTSKSAPQTNVNSPVFWYFGGALAVSLTLFVINKRKKVR